MGGWNTALGESFVIPGDSEDRKLDQFLTDALRQAKFLSDDTIDGFIKWDMTGYLTPQQRRQIRLEHRHLALRRNLRRAEGPAAGLLAE